jgi:hypothetical protein
MSSLTDFDYQPHRTVAAAVALQKGIYHLFALRSDLEADNYSRLIRSYQSLFQVSLTLLLLDDAFSLNGLLKHLQGPVKARCNDPEKPRRDELDPACVVTHSVFGRKWRGFPAAHPLAGIATEALHLYSRAVDARHNLLYRPFLLDNTRASSGDLEWAFGPYWEDCTLRELIGDAPSRQEIEAAYEHFAGAIWDWRNRDRTSEIPPDFILRLFEPYSDRSGERPTETVLLRYARLLSGDDQAILAGLRDYRNKLIDQAGHVEHLGIGFPPEWKVGEI